MGDDNISIKKFSDKKIILYCVCLLLIVFFYSLNICYDIGFYDGASNVCNPLSLGVDNEGFYVCFNESLYEHESNINVSMEGLKWH